MRCSCTCAGVPSVRTRKVSTGRPPLPSRNTRRPTCFSNRFRRSLVSRSATPAHVQEQRIPVREGQEVEIDLEFSLTYSPRDAVGYIDGYMVIVEGGRPHLGTKRKVRIAATARTGAYATVSKQKAN